MFQLLIYLLMNIPLGVVKPATEKHSNIKHINKYASTHDQQYTFKYTCMCLQICTCKANGREVKHLKLLLSILSWDSVYENVQALLL